MRHVYQEHITLCNPIFTNDPIKMVMDLEDIGIKSYEDITLCPAMTSAIKKEASKRS